jgi:large subunit ribosomal protein L25
MSDNFTLNASVREVVGKGASRRLRREEGLVPAIIYGGKHAGKARKPVNVTLKANEVKKALENEAFFSHILNLDVDGKSEQVILKDLQRHPATDLVQHADFLRVTKTTKIKAHVPVHFLNEEACVGVKLGGGKISHSLTSIDIICNAGDLPEFIEIDMAEVETGTVIHLSDIKFPKGVQSLALSHGEDHDTAVVSVQAPKGGAAEEEAAEGEGEEG